MNRGQRLCKAHGASLEVQLKRVAAGTQAKHMRGPCACACEVCGGNHQTWNCCDDCNYDSHRCHFCGDDLNHDGTVSATGYPNLCYLENP